MRPSRTPMKWGIRGNLTGFIASATTTLTILRIADAFNSHFPKPKSVLIRAPQIRTFLSSTSWNQSSEKESSRLTGNKESLNLQGFSLANGNRGGISLEPSEVYVAQLENLRDRSPSSADPDIDRDQEANEFVMRKNVIQSQTGQRRSRGGHALHPFTPCAEENTLCSLESSENPPTHVKMEYSNFVSEDDIVLYDHIRQLRDPRPITRAFHRAGPRKELYFHPQKISAAIVTCGGLCPGLNNVIRELVHSLYYLYGCSSVWGITGGFNGFHDPNFPPVCLTNENVENIHHEGGTVLRSGRGGFDIDKILSFLEEKNISQLYVIGGDGTHRGAYIIHEECMKKGISVAIAGIPKTIDNDVDFIDRSFGFMSAVEAAQIGIRTAKTEAMCNVPNGIGVVKLMGRSAGFLATYAALGSADVDLVLVPEVPIILDGPDGILPFLRQRVKEHGFAVVAVAEGAGEEWLGTSDKLDAGGNRARPQIGGSIVKAISNHFANFNETATIKYIDPSYMVRSVPANAADSLYCMQLAQHAVHGAMAGLTGFSVGLVNNVMVYVPIPLLVATSPRAMNPRGEIWENCVALTGQPNKPHQNQ